MLAKKLTPLLRQYLEIKQQYNDCLIFFRLGDFYELFFEDAEIASKVLSITPNGPAKSWSNWLVSIDENLIWSITFLFQQE